MSDIPRKPIPVRIQMDKLIEQEGKCALCKEPFESGQRRIVEHTPARAFLVANGIKNPDAPEYVSIVHKTCADLKTDGPSHLKVDGDKSKIAKAKRLSIARLAKDHVETRVGVDPGWRLKKKIDGSVVKVRTR